MITPMNPGREWSVKERVARLPHDQRLALLAKLPDSVILEIARDEWWWTARPQQIPPPGAWLIYLILSGRGFGKTRSGSEWIIQRALDHPRDRSGAPTERLIIAETIADARNICVNGPSGILRVLQRRQIAHRYVKSPKPHIIFLDSQCIIYVEGADNADVGRGYNAADVWLDEICKWPDPSGAWSEGIMPSLRADIPGDHPRALVTTTPKPLPLMREWTSRDDGTIIVVRGSTFDNQLNLSGLILQELRKRYDGTSLGLQELEGVLLEDSVGRIFSQVDIATARVTEPPEDLIRVVIGVDPGLTGEDDETSVIVVGQTKDYDLWVLADRTIMGVGREAALHCWRVFAQYDANRLVLETNLARRWMTETYEDAYRELVDEGILPKGNAPLEAVDAKHGKQTRAQPVGMRCEQHRLHMVGVHKILEQQMVEYDPMITKESPDRMDGLVHACRYLMRIERRQMKIVTPLSIVERRKQIPADVGGFSILTQLDETAEAW